MRISATDASRGFSDLLSRVAAGETVEVERHGQVVAVIAPPRQRFLSGTAVIELLRHAPPPDDAFAGDVRALGSILAHPADPWPPS